MKKLQECLLVAITSSRRFNLPCSRGERHPGPTGWNSSTAHNSGLDVHMEVRAVKLEREIEANKALPTKSANITQGI